MSKRIALLVWTATGIAALLLVSATLQLAQRARLEAPLGETRYIQGASAPAVLWTQPDETQGDPDHIEPGTAVTVHDVEDTDAGAWYYIEGQLSRGWIRAASLGETPP
jgi:hypothetical protein